MPYRSGAAFFMDNTLLQETAVALQNDWGLIVPDNASEEALLKLLADRVVDYLEKGPDAFYQLMYRIDISEKKLNSILHEEHVAVHIARLIYDRQVQKLQSRKTNKVQNTDDDPELKW
ncbi:MAG: hypothetical protein JWQ38_312 [Flavipsychrobacter sp.]|nr:hypothetical protein [Flavipsychrobacter sp.]